MFSLKSSEDLPKFQTSNSPKIVLGTAQFGSSYMAQPGWVLRRPMQGLPGPALLPSCALCPKPILSSSPPDLGIFLKTLNYPV